MVDAEVEPPLSWHLALPVAAGVIVDQLLLVRHPEQLSKFGAGLLELVRVVVLFDVVVLVVLCDDPLRRDGKRQNEGMSWDMKKVCISNVLELQSKLSFSTLVYVSSTATTVFLVCLSLLIPAANARNFFQVWMRAPFLYGRIQIPS